MTDPIADMLTRIRNASMRRLDVAELLHSKLVESVLVVFQEKGYIESFNVVGEAASKRINVVLKYDEKGHEVINELKRVSKPGRRVYKPAADIKKFKNGYGTIVVSTSKGVISNDEAHRLGVGGEVLCSIW